MNAMKTMTLGTILIGLSVSGAAVCKAEAGSAGLPMKPVYARSIDIGSKRAVAYFLNDNGRCKLALVVADAMADDVLPTDTPVRFDVVVDAGKNARFDTAEGKSLQFDCMRSAQSMTVREVALVAEYAATTK
jgi:hypothetical protein